MTFHYFLGPLSAFLSSIIWAIGSGQYARISESYSPLVINFTRALIAFPWFVIATLLFTGSNALFSIQAYDITWAALSILMSYGIGDVIFLIAAQWIGLPAALAIASCFPIWTVLADVLFEGSVISFVQIFGLLIAVGGVIIVVLSGSSSSNKKEWNKSLLGFGLAAASSILWAINSYGISKIASTHSAFITGTLRMGTGILITLFLSSFFIKPTPRFFSKLDFKKYFLLISFEAFLGSFCSAYGIAHSSLAVGVTLTSLAPVVAVPIAVLTGSERFSWGKSIGILCVVLGVCTLLGVFT